MFLYNTTKTNYFFDLKFFYKDVLRSFKRRNSGSWSPSRIIENFGGFSNNNGKYTNQSNEYTSNRPLRNRLVSFFIDVLVVRYCIVVFLCKVKLGDGIEIYEDQLRSVKWSDYRKLTRGLATILFSPAELATCSVTGQRWSRAGTGERPVKPALNKAKVQAIICKYTKYVPADWI